MTISSRRRGCLLRGRSASVGEARGAGPAGRQKAGGSLRKRRAGFASPLLKRAFTRFAREKRLAERRGGSAQSEADRRVQQEQGRKREALGLLAEGVAHDFNNILSGILGLTEIVIGRCLPPGSPALSYLEDVMEAGGRARDLIARIHCLGPAAGGRRSPCRLRALLEEVLPLAEEAMPPGARLKRDLRWKGAEVLADAGQIRQLLMNLLTNAVQSLAGLPGEVAVRLERTELTEALLPHPDLGEGTFACLTVADTGHGMAAATLSRIFDPYFTTRKQEGGKGMGLSLAQGIARRHGGAITVESERGKGSVFRVYLPLVPSGGGKRQRSGCG
jgi:signal transduction histidine kinase